MTTYRVEYVVIPNDSIQAASGGDVVIYRGDIQNARAVDVAYKLDVGAVVTVIVKEVENAGPGLDILLVREGISVNHSPGRYIGHFLDVYFFALD